MFVHKPTRPLALLVLLLLVAAACGGTTGEGAAEVGDDATTTATEDGDGALPVVRLHGLEGGLSSMALKIIEEQGFDEQNGFQGEFFEVSGTPRSSS